MGNGVFVMQRIDNTRNTENTERHPDYTRDRYRGRKMKVKTFFTTCLTCDSMKLHSTQSGHCLTCSEDPRIAARLTYKDKYQAFCDTHGTTEFSVRHGQCLECYTSLGKLRASYNMETRATARNNGQKTYKAHCNIHGTTEFSVRIGKCLTCFTEMGIARSSAVESMSPRSVARRNDWRTYEDTCSTHGSVKFSVRTGKCLTCFTGSGWRRSNGTSLNPRANPTRVLARHLGMSSFLHVCATHGQVEHSVAHGKCLKCFTAAGYLRKVAL